MSIAHDPQKDHPFLAPGALDTPPGTTDEASGTIRDARVMVPPLTPGTAAFDLALSAVIDRLMAVEDHQLAIEDHLLAIDDHVLALSTNLTAVKALVEELVP